MMTEVEAQVSEIRKISPVWIVPIIAILLGAYMVFYSWQNEGPEITIHFDTADGIVAGKTKVRSRSVGIGVVEGVELSEDFEHVIVTAKMENFARPLLREDSELWVVTARVGAGGVSGLGTILSGGYIELNPGEGEEGKREFIGLNEIPVTSAGTPGLHFTLSTDKMGSINMGNPILYKGFAVGEIESKVFDVEKQVMTYGGFVEAPYDKLVTKNTRFWDVSGVSFSATANGIEFQTSSFEALLIGGVGFGLPENVQSGAPAEPNAEFKLFPDNESINETPYRYFTEYVVFFDRSVRGLLPGAPVEYRGLPAGEVVRIMIKEMQEIPLSGRRRDGSIAVLIRMEPGPLLMGDSPEGVEFLKAAVNNAIAKGMRATLVSGNLITGSLLVTLDYHDGLEPGELGTFAGHPTIPSAASGLQNIEIKISALLDKLNALPVEDVVDSANDALTSADTAFVELQKTIDELNAILANHDTQALPGAIQDSLDELNRTMRQVGGLAETLESEPSSIIFSRRHDADPEPSAGVP
jgi:paraquat-inducible protein B